MTRIERKPATGPVSNLRSPIYRGNLMLLRQFGIRLSARFVVAMKDPRHPLGKLFARHDLRQYPVFLKAFQNKDRDQLAYRLQCLFLGERVMVRHALGDIYRAERLSGRKEAERELMEEDPKITEQRWKVVQQKVEKRLARMGLKAREQFQAGVWRALISLRHEELVQKENPPHITSQEIMVSQGPDGRIALDFISSTFSPELLERVH